MRIATCTALAGGFALAATLPLRADDAGASSKASGSPGATGYPRADLLIEAEALAAPGALSKYVVLDARGPRANAEARIPGSRAVDAAAWAKAFGDGSDAEGWSRRIGQLGIGAGTPVVVFDDALSKDAARVWWILRYWGVEDARLLNGGWKAWQAGKHPVETGAPASVQPVPFTARAHAARHATKESILKSLAAPGSLQIVDARSEAEYCGTDKLSNRRGGAIPGAKHLEWSDLLDKTTQRFLPPVEIRKRFESAGIDVQKPTATHCQSGGRSSVVVFALELLGAKDPRNYYAGWSEWGNADDTPIVPGKPASK
jgi:thiosulfate/3-mercaptopyruvate sulfurtransferase